MVRAGARTATGWVGAHVYVGNDEIYFVQGVVSVRIGRGTAPESSVGRA